jgi:hypothetical protein
MDIFNSEVVEDLEDLKFSILDIKNEKNKIELIKHMIHDMKLKYTKDGNQILFNLSNFSDKDLLALRNLVKKCS